MKKKIFGTVLVVAIVAGAMINVNLNKVSNKGDLALANVEALAGNEVTFPFTCVGTVIYYCIEENGFIRYGYLTRN